MKRIVWTDQAKSDVRALDKTTALRFYMLSTVSPNPVPGT
jgi:hypothetical protein